MIEVLGYFLTVLIGIGCIGYVTFTWAMHLANTGQYLMMSVMAGGTLLVSAAAAVRIPIALFLFFGAAAAIGSTFLLGYGHLVLP